MLIPRKEKGQLEIYKCKLGIHDWVTEHWWETRQKPRKAIFSKKGGRKRAQYYTISIILNIVRELTVESVVKRKREMRTKKVEVVKDRWTDGLALEISHNGWQTTSISNLDVEDLKRIRKVIRKAIRNHENNNNKRR